MAKMFRLYKKIAGESPKCVLKTLVEDQFVGCIAGVYSSFPDFQLPACSLDVCMNTNDYGTDPANGRYDALNGLVLSGNGKGKFEPLTIKQSVICIPGNGKGLARLKSANGKYLLVAGQNKSPLKVFQLKTP